MNTPVCPPPDAQPCSTCGEAACLCRPRFFAGQLLTDADLNALQNYMIEKQRRHNRFLHGAGVVCGLGVVCHDCAGWVSGKSGYALGHCGEEIYVPCDHPLNVCEIVRRCRTRSRDYFCDPYVPKRPVDREPLTERWYITLRYAETESRGLAALRPASATCHCGGAAGCECGSKANRAAGGCRTTAPGASRGVGCEATRVCEGYVLDVVPAPPAASPDVHELLNGTALGALVQCFRKVGELPARIRAVDDSVRGETTTPDQFLAAAQRYRQVAKDFLNDLGDPCPGEIPATPIPGPNDPFTRQPYEVFRRRVLTTIQNAWRRCPCRAALPPCPEEVDDERLVLACVTTSGTECRIVDICPAQGRQQLVTTPSLMYWLSVFPLLWELFEKYCCQTLDERALERVFVPRGVRGEMGPFSLAGSMLTPGSIAEVFLQTIARELRALLQLEE